MSSLSVRLPDSLHEKVRELARRDDVSINQFIATEVAEKASALLTVDYLKQRARRAEPELFARLLNRVPDVAPLAGDELPAEVLSQTASGARRRGRRVRVRDQAVSAAPESRERSREDPYQESAP